MKPIAWKTRLAQAYPFAPQPYHPGVSPSGTPPDDATHVIWQDPSSYNPFFHGPPYLPGMEVHMNKAASSRSIVAKVVSAAGPDLSSVLVFLRSLAFIHQSHHWLTFGGDYYGDHLLFERLYNQTTEEIDQIAEKAVGVGAPIQKLHPGLQASLVAQVVASFCGNGVTSGEADDPSSYVMTSLAAERHFIDCMKQIAEGLKATGTLSRGVDNLLAGIEDKHEGHIYLLGQRSKKDPWKVTD
jgi:hypothetical protein